MTTPRVLTPNELEFDLGEAGNARLAEARRLAALARVEAHIKALEADAAARLAILRDHAASMRSSVESGDLPMGEDAVGEMLNHLDDLDESLNQPQPGAALLEEQRKALVRARNEGLEKAAEEFLRRRDFINDRPQYRRGLESAASIARAMKEPE